MTEEEIEGTVVAEEHRDGVIRIGEGEKCVFAPLLYETTMDGAYRTILDFKIVKLEEEKEE